jgi:hypothetical protein
LTAGKTAKESFVKRVILVFVVMIVVAGSISAQGSGSGAKNWISGELSLLGAGVSYERMLGSQFSVGGDVYWSSFFIILNELEVGAFGRFYPWAGIFFVEAGLGFHLHTWVTGNLEWEVISGIAITPAVGWKIDVGNPGGFFIRPGIKFPVTFGNNALKEKFDVGLGFVPYIGLGGAF